MSLTKQEVQQRSILQADKLLTHACENRKMLLEYDEDVIPYSIRNLLKKSTLEKDSAEAHLNLILDWKDTTHGSEGISRAKFQEVHSSFTRTAERLAAVSSLLNKALTVEPEQNQ
jgi:hypothetical protein